MESILSTLESVGFDLRGFLIASAVVIAGSVLLSLVSRWIFGKRSAVNHAISSAIGILFLYALTIVFYSAGEEFHRFIAPLPFVTFSDEQILLFSLTGAHYTELCSQILSMVILAFLVNLLDTVLPKGKSVLGWFFYRCLTVLLSLVLHLLVTYLFNTYLPEGIVIYAPTILLFILLIMLAVGALKLVIGLVLATVNPLIGALYTFFFANVVGKQLSKALLTTALLAGLVYGLAYLGISTISISSAALIAYIPFLVILLVVWSLVNRISVKD